VDEFFIQRAHAYAVQWHLQLAEPLGSGVHGIIFVADNKSKSGKTALKVHREREPYLRERGVYERLAQAGIDEICGFNVPQFVRADDESQIIEMTTVRRPFVLDFAGAYLDRPPDFSEEVMADWESEKLEQFGLRWSAVQSVLYELKRLGIHMVDVSPSNIAFAP
jgi:hypothetical protein